MQSAWEYCNKKDAVRGSKEAQQCGLLIRQITWLTRGVQDLVRLVLQRAVARAAQEMWATRSLTDIFDIFAKQDLPYR